MPFLLARPYAWLNGPAAPNVTVRAESCEHAARTTVTARAKRFWAIDTNLRGGGPATAPGNSEDETRGRTVTALERRPSRASPVGTSG